MMTLPFRLFEELVDDGLVEVDEGDDVVDVELRTDCPPPPWPMT